LELILGRAGSGKTEACIRQIGGRLAAGGEEECIFLTPEQATFANEKRLLRALGGRGGFQLKVLSFRRLVHWVLQETGGGLLPALDAVGKGLVLRNILERQKSQLQAFRRVWNKKGFVAQLAALMDELRVYRVAPPALAACLENGGGEGLPPDLAGKLEDIAAVFGDYEAFLSQGWLDLAGELALLCGKLPAWPRLAKLSFWLDGFHGFTPAELQVIRSLLAAGRPVKVTLTLPRGAEKQDLAEDELFYPAWETARDLERICRREGFAMEPPVYMETPRQRRFIASPSLARLEEALAGEGGPAAGEPVSGGESAAAGAPVDGEPVSGGDSAAVGASADGESVSGGESAAVEASVRLASCGDMRQEVERLAVEILEAAREDGLRYKDMAVLLRRPEAYESLFHSILPSYGIPYFFDGTKPLRYHPLVCLLKELIAVMKDHWNTGTLMAYVKTGLSGLSDNQGAALENYCLAYGVQRMHWESGRPWSFTLPGAPDKEARDAYMEALRQKLWQPVLRLRKRLEQALTVESMVAAVYEHLRELGVEEACSRWANEALEKGEPELAQIHQRAWQKMMELFDQTVLFLTPADGADSAAPDPAMLAAVWESGLEVLEMAALPPALDQVTICSMDRSRSPLAARVWILGANAGILPAHIQEDSLLAASERQWLAQRQVYLAPDSRRRMLSEAYLIYIALTRASQRISVSCARADIQGKAQAPSPLLEQLCRLFPGLTIDEKEPALTRRLTRPAASLQLLGLALQNEESNLRAKEAEEIPAYQWGELWRFVFQWFYRQEGYRRDMERLAAAYDLAPLGQPLPKTLAEQLFGRVIKTSVTRLEQFQACPFAHFLAFGLKLETRAEYEVRPPAVGNFFHDSLEALNNQVKSRGLFLGALGREELEAWVAEVARDQLAQKSHEIFLSSAWYRRLADNLGRILQSSARALAYQEAQGSFRPYALEAPFGFDEPGSLPPVTLDLGEGRRILLRGRIDRVDEALLPQTGQRFLRVVDYKSGHKTLALHEVYHGLKLQLVLYMEAALAALPQAEPAGLFYFQVHDPMLRAANIREALDEQWRQEKILKAQSLQGYLLQNREVAALMDRNYGKSLFLPVSELKTGEFGKDSKLLSGEGFRLLGNYSRRLLNQAGQRIMNGDISLAPYQTGGKNACVYCPYSSVCRFDPAVPGHSYRYLPAFSDQAVLGKLRAGAAGEGGGAAGEGGGAAGEGGGAAGEGGGAAGERGGAAGEGAGAAGERAGAAGERAGAANERAGAAGEKAGLAGEGGGNT
jgi:ATP-dependent helicase/nuclease subunit B